jgi:uncharacterized protein YcgI (DUF1989 family)
MSNRKLIDEFFLEPTTGRAIPVLKGHILHVEQVGMGQALDFNAYNLHDYKEYFHAGRTRVMHGLHPRKGDHLWTNPPRDRVMFTIIEDTVGTNDVNFPRCTAFRYEYRYGFSGYPPHSNCADIFAEAIREWGLTPDDVHDSFNGFSNTGVTPEGTLYFDRSIARKGDYLEFLAHIDTLAVPVSCGSDLSMSANFDPKGLNIAIFEGNDEDKLKLSTKKYDHQRTVEQFKVREIKADRELRRDPNYVPEWPWMEAVKERISIEVTLDERQSRLLEDLKKDPWFQGFTEAEIVRFCFFRWWMETFTHGSATANVRPI